MISEFAKERVFWTRKMNLKLVKFIENKPHIWNHKHTKYFSVAVRDQTYSEFASKYGNEFTGQAVKDRWTNIRSTFANYLRKLNASRAKGDGEEYKVNWHLWEACQFLLKVNKNSKTEYSTTDDFNHNDEKNDIKLQDSSEEDIITNGSLTNNKTKCSEIVDNLMNVFKDLKNDVFALENTKHSQIGRAVASKLSQLDSYDAAQLSHKIMEILLLYDKNNLMNPNRLKSEKNITK